MNVIIATIYYKHVCLVVSDCYNSQMFVGGMHAGMLREYLYCRLTVGRNIPEVVDLSEEDCVSFCFTTRPG